MIILHREVSQVVAQRLWGVGTCRTYLVRSVRKFCASKFLYQSKKLEKRLRLKIYVGANKETERERERKREKGREREDVLHTNHPLT